MKKLLFLIIMIAAVTGIFAERMITLEEARELLLQNNPEYLAKESSLNSAQWEMRQSLAALFPAARLQGGYNYLDPKPFAAAQENYSLSYGVSVSQPLFSGGKLWLSYRMSRDALKIAQADLDNTKLNLFSKLEEAYYNYLLTQELYQINRQALVIAETHLAIARIRLEAGTLSQAEFLQFRSEFSSREVALLQAENNRQLSYRQLQNLIKIENFSISPVEPSAYEDLASFFQELQAEQREAIRERLITYGIEHNPMLLISRTGQDISRKALTMAKGNFLPSVSLSASRNWNNNYSGEYDFDSSTTYMISASIPIFPLADNFSGYRKSYHSYRKAERETEAAEDNIKLAIESAYYSGMASAKTIISADLAKEYAEETYRMMEERFRNGLISSVELISIELLLTTSSLEAANSKYNFLKNRSLLKNLLNIENDRELMDIMNDES
jgi:outer membrane protein TolC